MTEGEKLYYQKKLNAAEKARKCGNKPEITSNHEYWIEKQLQHECCPYKFTNTPWRQSSENSTLYITGKQGKINMNREIKFRAWDREKQRLKRVTRIDFPEWHISTQGKTYYDDGDRNSFKNEDSDRCWIMQYTGFKDLNGIEIYEQDVLKVQLNIDNIQKMIVKYSNGSYYSGKFLLKNVLHKCKIIGNIYENEITK